MSEKRPFLRAAGLVGGITLASRFLGLFRDIVLASFFGAGRLGDIFLIAFEMPNLVRRILGEGSLSAFIVPIFTQVRQEEGDEAGWRFASNALLTMGLVSLVLTALGVLLAEPLFSLFGYGYLERGDTEALQLGAHLTRIMFPFLMLLAVSSILMGLCHSLRHFTTPALGSIMLNLSMIAAGLIFWRVENKTLAAQAMAGAVLLGALLRVLIMLPALFRLGFRFYLRFKPGAARMRRLYLMLLPALYGLAVVQLNISISRAFATWLGEGYVPCLVFSNRLVQLPLAIIASAFATAILPSLSTLWNASKKEELADLSRFALRLNWIFFVPAMFGLIALGEPIIAMLFERRLWDAQATAQTYWALLFYAPGLVVWGMLRILTPIYYAQQDVRTPVLSATAATFLNIGLNVLLLTTPLLRDNLGHGGLALATTLGVLLNSAILLFILHRRGLVLWNWELSFTALRVLLAGAVMAGAVRLAWHYWIDETFQSPLIQGMALCLLMAAGGGLYFATAWLLRVPDLAKGLEVLARRRKRAV